MVLRLFYYTICQPDSENDAQNTGKPVSACLRPIPVCLIICII